MVGSLGASTPGKLVGGGGGNDYSPRNFFPSEFFSRVLLSERLDQAPGLYYPLLILIRWIIIQLSGGCRVGEVGG